MEKKIIVIGSLNPQKNVQDRVRVLHKGGECQGLRATDYKDPPKVVRKYEKESDSSRKLWEYSKKK
jgi:hypothetical protein